MQPRNSIKRDLKYPNYEFLKVSRSLLALLPYSFGSLFRVTVVRAVVSIAIVMAMTMRPNKIHAMANMRPL